MKFGIFAHTGRKKAIQEAEKCKSFLSSKGYIGNLESSLEKIISKKPGMSEQDICSQSDILIAFGGDGTLLRAAKYSNGKPILGVNLGTMGFLAEFTPEDFPTIFEKIISKKFTLQSRIEIEASLVNGKKFTAINDIAVERGESAKMLFSSLTIDGEFVSNYKSDGIIVASPSGSTAYSLSAGGPVIEPTTSVFAITPISPHMLSIRSMVISNDRKIKIQVRNPCLLNCDGVVVSKLEPNHAVYIQKAPTAINIIINPKRTYYETLREKLNWGKGF